MPQEGQGYSDLYSCTRTAAAFALVCVVAEAPQACGSAFLKKLIN